MGLFYYGGDGVDESPRSGLPERSVGTLNEAPKEILSVDSHRLHQIKNLADWRGFFNLK